MFWMRVTPPLHGPAREEASRCHRVREDCLRDGNVTTTRGSDRKGDNYKKDGETEREKERGTEKVRKEM